MITVENREKIVLDRGVDQKVFTFDYVADIDVPSPNRKSFLRLLNPLLTAASKATIDRSRIWTDRLRQDFHNSGANLKDWSQRANLFQSEQHRRVILNELLNAEIL